MKYIFWCLAILASALPLQAQVRSSLSIEIHLQAEPLLLTSPTIYVEQVLDARPYQAQDLGFGRRGLGTVVRPIQLPQSAAAELQSFLRNRLTANAAARPVVLRLTGLSATEADSKGTGTGVADELAAEYYARRPDTTYFLLCRVEANITTLATDPTRQHAANLAELLRRGLEQIERVDWAAQQAAGPFYTTAQLRQPAAAVPYPIQTTALLRPGVYRSFLEFRQNAPGQPGNVTVDARNYYGSEWQGLRTVAPFLLTPEGTRMAVEDAWGFCDGQQIYIRQGKDYYLLERRGPVFMFFAPSQRPNNNTLIYGGPPKAPFSLGLEYGLVTDYTGVASGRGAEVPRPTHLMLYRRRGGSPTPLPVFLDGKPVGQLPANDYLSVPLQYTGYPVRLCVGAETCLEVRPSFSEANYVEYQPAAATPLQVVPVREGAAQVTRMAGR
ncbi:hypothetical protein [Hymenobacter psychrotolerans]|uniref:hypothetical protein n=1 Tax=Hymenobacter psychrotolerans TaxID=344998 RepID=UPI001114FC0E|nr:hypothetical protein [Hymenobacter psychrotolerans]